MPSPTTPARPNRLRKALVASALVHALAVLGVALLPSRAPEPAADQPVDEVTTVELTVEEGLAAPAALEAREQPAAPDPKQAPGRARRAQPSEPRSEETPAPTAGASETAPSDVLRMRTPALALRPEQFEATLGDLPPAASDAPSRSSRAQRWQERMEAATAAAAEEEEAQAAVARGRAHPFLFEVGRDVARLFRPTRDITNGDKRDLTAGNTARSWGRGLVKGFEQYVAHARNGTLDQMEQLAPPGAPLVSPNPRDPVVDVLAGYNAALTAAAAGAVKIACEVCVTFAPGAEPRAELRKSANNAAIDALALDAAVRASHRRPVPADVSPTKACYSFDVSIARTPPVPMVGCGFDETSLGASSLDASCYWPLRKMLKASVRLRSVRPAKG